MRLGLDIGWDAGVAIDTIEASRDASLGGLGIGLHRLGLLVLSWSASRGAVFVCIKTIYKTQTSRILMSWMDHNSIRHARVSQWHGSPYK